MTPKQLEKLNIFDVSSKLRKRTFYFEAINKEVKIPPSYGIEQIFGIAQDHWLEVGVKMGKNEKIREFQKVFNIEDVD